MQLSHEQHVDGVVFDVEHCGCRAARARRAVEGGLLRRGRLDGAGCDARQFERVVDQGQQLLARRVHPLEFVALGTGVAAVAFGEQQLREAEHGVERGAQLVAHAGQELRLGAALAQRQLTLTFGALGHLGLGDVPVDADATHDPPAFVEQRGRARGQPAHAAIGPDDTEFVGQRVRARQLRHRVGDDVRPVVGMHQGQARLGAERLRLWRQAAQREHLCIPIVVTGRDVVVPRAHADAAHRQRGALVGFTQAQQGLALFGDVDQHAESARIAAAAGFHAGAQLQPVRRTVGPDNPEFGLQCTPARIARPAEGLRGERVAIVDVDAAPQQLAHRHRPVRRIEADQLVHQRIPLGRAAIERARPQADVRGLGRGLQPLCQLQRKQVPLMLRRHIQADAAYRHGPAVGVALQHPAGQHHAPGAVGMQVAGARVDGTSAGDGFVECRLYPRAGRRGGPSCARCRAARRSRRWRARAPAACARRGACGRCPGRSARCRCWPARARGRVARGWPRRRAPARGPRCRRPSRRSPVRARHARRRPRATANESAARCRRDGARGSGWRKRRAVTARRGTPRPGGRPDRCGPRPRRSAASCRRPHRCRRSETRGGPSGPAACAGRAPIHPGVRTPAPCRAARAAGRSRPPTARRCRARRAAPAPGRPAAGAARAGASSAPAPTHPATSGPPRGCRPGLAPAPAAARPCRLHRRPHCTSAAGLRRRARQGHCPRLRRRLARRHRGVGRRRNQASSARGGWRQRVYRPHFFCGAGGARRRGRLPVICLDDRRPAGIDRRQAGKGILAARPGRPRCSAPLSPAACPNPPGSPKPGSCGRSGAARAPTSPTPSATPRCCGSRRRRTPGCR